MEHLCKYIVESKDTRRLLPDPESEPDFWAISRVYPLKKHTKSLPENVPVCAQPSVFTHNMVLSALSSLQPRLCSTGWMEELLPPAKRLVTQDLGRSVTFGMLPPSTVLDLNPSSSSSSTSTSLSAALSQNRQVSLRERLLLEQQELQPVAQQKTSVIEALRQCRRSPVKDRSPYKSPPFVATSSRPSAIGDWLRQHTQKR